MIHYKGFNLPRDLALVTKVLLYLTYYSIRLKFSSVQNILSSSKMKKHTLSQGRTPSEAEVITLGKLYRSSTFLIRRIFRNDRPCLRRALLLYHYCCHRGIGVTFIVGVKKQGGELESHAWVEINGNPFMESPAYIEKFQPILGT